MCLDFVSRNLAAVMGTDGYRHMTRSCPGLQAELLQTIAAAPAPAAAAPERGGNAACAAGGGGGAGAGQRSAGGGGGAAGGGPPALGVPVGHAHVRPRDLGGDGGEELRRVRPRRAD